MTAYLAKLNADQRRAVEHGGADAPPLLIIAGAGSGKRTLGEIEGEVQVLRTSMQRMAALAMAASNGHEANGDEADGDEPPKVRRLSR
jgi:hypothetical protein